MKFKLDINLDDSAECQSFIDTHGTIRPRVLSKKLGLRGKGSANLANGLRNYAWNKITAIDLRLKGNIQDAQRYEAICDRIYDEDIQPVCECW